jgi:ATP-dependent DNA helicase RecG
VANLLVHREYLHQFPARIIIYRDQVEFTNPCNPVYKGNIDDDDFLPNQKNPIISKFFLQLGWVEEIGSGIYNIKKYLPFYTPGRMAIFNEDIIFTTIIPIPTPEDLQTRNIKETTLHGEVTTEVIKLVEAVEGEMAGEEILSKLKLKNKEHLRKGYLNPAVEAELLALTIPDKPNSKHQKYRLTEKGKVFLKNRTK